MTRGIALTIRGLVVTGLIVAFAGGSALLRAQQPAQPPAAPSSIGCSWKG